MKAFWNSKKPLCQQDILDHVKENGDLFLKERSIFAIINSLMLYQGGWDGSRR